MIFDGSVKFYGTYRPYQQRALDNLSDFLNNDKIHIVAAPGSGKTILGLELIRRLDNVSLVLVPTITIREQWIERFTTCFLSHPEDANKWISNDIRVNKPIICITYQALYSAFKRNNETDEESDEYEMEQSKDYSSFDLYDSLLKYNIQTICLDECHHLKSEWWKVLESTVKKIKGVKIISLTATPPYDSSTQEWQKYIDLCGPIDEEIFVPELISDKNLCPHQDYVYFSYPTEDEELKLMRFYANGIKMFHKYKNHPELLEIVKSNKVYLSEKQYKASFYKNPAYYRALIIYLVANDVKVKALNKILARVEPLQIKHFEILLQNVLFDDQDSYTKTPLLLAMKKEFSALGVVNKRNVNLSHDERIDRLLSLSNSKLTSISEIVRYEYASMTSNLKCLILTDYIKLKEKSFINDMSRPINTLGSVPIFEHLRRQNIKGIKLCLLSGTICMIPSDCCNRLNEIIKDEENEFEFVSIKDIDYVEVLIKNSTRKRLVSAITLMFNEGLFNVIIGTKALLGEGWDSPCINTLIMASFVGSYVLSNQTRGRAIRTDIQNINKISNVWHLVCLDPYNPSSSNDYFNIKKRFSTFIGVDYSTLNIEDGIERLSITNAPRSRYEAQISNNKMIKLSINRELTRQTWEKGIKKANQVEVLTKVTYFNKKRLRKTYSFYVSIVQILLWGALFFTAYQTYFNGILETSHTLILDIILILAEAFIAYGFSINVMHFLRQIKPINKLKAVGDAILKALIKSGKVTSKNSVVVCKVDKNSKKLMVYLKNASTYEQNIFSDSIYQTLANVEQPRYLIAKPKGLFKREYYIVPDAFKKNIETTKPFCKAMSSMFGKYATIFAKNEQGKNEVLKAQFIYYRLYGQSELETKRILLEKKVKKTRAKWK